MHDPDEGVSSAGTIVTGARRARVPQVFEPVLAAAVDDFEGLVVAAGIGAEASLQLYGSVATGCARHARSDVDLLALGLPVDSVRAMGGRLSSRFAGVCRAVDVARVGFGDMAGQGDEAYGNRVFLRHYCLPLAGHDPVDRSVAYPADVRAARGFNGDIGLHLARWRSVLDSGANPSELGRTVARKSLLAVAGLVSVHDRTWTTDRLAAAKRWAAIDPATAVGLGALVDWLDGVEDLDRRRVTDALDGPVESIVVAFDDTIGLWS